MLVHRLPCFRAASDSRKLLLPHQILATIARKYELELLTPSFEWQDFPHVGGPGLAGYGAGAGRSVRGERGGREGAVTGNGSMSAS